MLVPNGLKVLSQIGVYSALQKRGWPFDYMYFQSGPTQEILETIESGNVKKHGISCLRIYRSVVLEVLLDAVKEKGIPIHFGKKFSVVVEETENNVSFQFSDGTQETASLLTGADGIYSTVRSYLAPDIRPVFAGMAAIVAAVPTAQLELPPPKDRNINSASNPWPLPSGVIVPGLGAFITSPQTANGDECLITVTRSLPLAPSWSKVDADKPYLRSLLRQNSTEFPDFVQNAVKEIPDENLRIWPFYHIPRLERWTSAKREGGYGRVVIVGDGAHAIPPSAGQGVNQAFEDVYLLALMLGRVLGGPKGLPGGRKPASNAELERALFGWQRFRQERVDKVLELNRQMDLRRMPKVKKEPKDAGGEEKEKELGDLNVMFDWLFNLDFEKAVDECLENVNGEEVSWENFHMKQLWGFKSKRF